MLDDTMNKTLQTQYDGNKHCDNYRHRGRSSGKHGDVFSFLQEVEGLSFPEAVERLAEEAGLEVPRSSARSKKQVEVQRTLLDVVELAAEGGVAAVEPLLEEED